MPVLPEFRILRHHQRLDDPGVASFLGIAQRVDERRDRSDFRVIQCRLNPAPVFSSPNFSFMRFLKRRLGSLAIQRVRKL